jgi:hypothetical protein
VSALAEDGQRHEQIQSCIYPLVQQHPFELSYLTPSKVHLTMSSNATPGCFAFLRRSRGTGVGNPPADPGALSRRSHTPHTSEPALRSHYVPEPCGCSLASHDLASLQIRDELPPYHSVREVFNKDVSDFLYSHAQPALPRYSSLFLVYNRAESTRRKRQPGSRSWRTPTR